MPSTAPDPLSAQVHEAFMRLVHRQRLLLHRVLSRHDLHPAQAMCLRVLAHKEAVAQRDLGEALLLSAPSVTRMLQRMERAGLVERTADPRDQRQSVVRLTAAGHALQADVHAALAEFLERSVARLPEADRRELARLLGAWSEAAGDGCLPPGRSTTGDPATGNATTDSATTRDEDGRP
ncbi:MAG: MarR family winged helix-turn-helix transcriptional regulator [Kineosporiaceae bacterium]